MAAFATIAMWLQLLADIVAACLIDGPAGAGQASRVARRRRRTRRGLLAAP